MEHMPWYSPPPGILQHINFPHGGGHMYIASSGDDESPVLRTMPLGAYDAAFPLSLKFVTLAASHFSRSESRK